MSFVNRIKAISRSVSHFLGEGIWNVDLAGVSPKRGKLYKHLKIILITHRHFQSLRCGREAVALSFFTTMATVPLIAVILLIASRFGLLELLTETISGLFINNQEMGKMVLGWANNIVHMASGGGFGIVSSLTFLWLVLWMMLCVENSFNHIWDVGKSANLLRRIIVYFSILILSPFVLVMFLLGVGLVLFGIWKGGFTKSRSGIWPAGIGTVLVVMAVFFIAGYNGTAYYPSYTDLQSSQTIRNSSSSHFTLQVMFWVSLLIPFVLAYIVYAWRPMDKKKITGSEINSTEHKY